MMKPKRVEPIFAVCVNNQGNPASLERDKINRVLPDGDALEGGEIRVVDESGEDYVYPAENFVVIDLPSRGQGCP